MGLRTKVLIVMVALLTLLATASTALVHFRVSDSIRERESIDATRDMRLLLAVLNTQLVQIDGVLSSWSNWTGLYEHAASPNADFRAHELSAPAVAVGQMDWLAIVGPGGQVIEQVVATPATETGLLPAPHAAGAAETAERIAALSSRRPRACGLFQLEAYLGLVCYRPLLNSEGRGEPHGTVVVGRRITSGMLADVAEQSRLRFSLIPRSGTETVESTGDAEFTPFGALAPTIHATDATQLSMSMPLLDIGERHLADLQLDWPRVAMAAARQELAQTAWLVLLLIVGTGVTAILVVDRLVVRRLARMRDELGSIVAAGKWNGGIQASGRDEITALAAFINHIIGVVRQQVADLAYLASTDTLTGLGNRRCFDERLAKVVARFERTGQASALVLIDVDFFKLYNDLYGHPAGDHALRLVAQSLRELARRQGDLAARVGGEEFALLLEDADLDIATALAEAARGAIRGASVPHAGSTVASVLTLSCGVAEVRASDTPSTFYMRADQALYQAKQSGRDHVAREPATEI